MLTPSSLSLALFQPEIPSNTGSLMRLAACLGFPLHIIGPTGFAMNDKALRRAGMDYRETAVTHIHQDYDAFESSHAWSPPRIILMTTKATMPYTEFRFAPGDMIMMGRETSGAPDWLHDRADARLVIPMRPDQRSINMSLSAGLVMGEALRQTNGFPAVQTETAL